MARGNRERYEDGRLPPLPDFNWLDVFVVAISAIVCALTVQEFPAASVVPDSRALTACRMRAIAFLMQFVSVTLVLLGHLQYSMYTRHPSQRLFAGRCVAAIATIAYAGVCVWIGVRAMTTPGVALNPRTPQPPTPFRPPTTPATAWQQCSRADPLVLQIGWTLLSTLRVCWITGAAVGKRALRALRRWLRVRRAAARAAAWYEQQQRQPHPPPPPPRPEVALRDAVADALVAQRSPQRMARMGVGELRRSPNARAYDAQHAVRIDADSSVDGGSAASHSSSPIGSASAGGGDVWSPPLGVTAQLALLRAADPTRVSDA